MEDTDAIYPLRIDPTFTDANWLCVESDIPGPDGEVLTTAVDGSGNLYIGGNFSTAGGKASPYLAEAIIADATWLSIQPRVPGPHTNTLTFLGIPGSNYITRFATNLTTSPWLRLATNTPGAYGLGTIQDPTATNAQRFYRLTR